ncbi:MAG: hypothetical protein NE328_10175 [Lentisphaeraceae bacterium]|nr:hypothetical protein [Lentisphaeraceae bacterium]
MKLNPTDAYLISPYIIWGELDYRGRVSLGVKPKENFKSLDFLSKLQTPCQYIRCKNKDYLFISFPLADFTPDCSIFNLTDLELKEFYQKTYQNSQDAILKTYYRIKHLSGQEIDSLKTEELAELWHYHFNPLTDFSTLPEFNPADSLLTNCLPGYTVRNQTSGFELNGCIHHFIKVLSFCKLNDITRALEGYFFSTSLYADKCEIIIHISAENSSLINQRSLEVKELLHSIPKTDYYEANEIGENVNLFEVAIPGWCSIHGSTL